MKRITLLLLFYCVAISGILAQGVHIKTGATIGEKFLIASLPNTTGVNHHKLKIEIFGGNFYNTTLATRTYSISAREGLVINQEQHGGMAERYKLCVYKSDLGYDFVIESTNSYMSVFIQAWLGYVESGKTIDTITGQSISKYEPGNNQDITSQVTFNIISSTDINGNIGIGTLTPNAKLDVRGKVLAEEVEIKIASGADFVFESDYKLRPLPEVETFVKENKHLPEIPSEKQMQEEGVSVNDLQIKLLQKIEELTLYVIEQDKKIKELEEKLNN